MSDLLPATRPTGGRKRRCGARVSLGALLALGLGTSVSAQSDEPAEPFSLEYADRQDPAYGHEPYPIGLRTPRFVDLAFSTKSFELEYRSLTYREDGFVGVGLLVNEDDDFAFNARIARVGQIVGVPCRLGVGIAGYAAHFDEPDETAYALGIMGLIEYDLLTVHPSVLVGELTVAPDITTFDDGERLVDFRLRLRTNISDVASAFIGYHGLRIETTRGRSIDNRLHVGISLGF